MEKDIIKYENLVLFDGICSLCSSIVKFLKSIDKYAQFKFIAFQSELGKNISKEFGLSDSKMDTIILIDKEVYFVKSDAILKIVNKQKFPWNWLMIFKIIPRSIRDAIYDLISKNRYKIFGTTEYCEIDSNN